MIVALILVPLDSSPYVAPGSKPGLDRLLRDGFQEQGIRNFLAMSNNLRIGGKALARFVIGESNAEIPKKVTVRTNDHD
jgi:hypothetical protein